MHWRLAVVASLLVSGACSASEDPAPAPSTTTSVEPLDAEAFSEPTTTAVADPPCLAGLRPEAAAATFLRLMIEARTSAEFNSLGGCLDTVPPVFTGEIPACWTDCEDARRTFAYASFQVGRVITRGGETHLSSSIFITYATPVGLVDIIERWEVVAADEGYEIRQFSISEPHLDRERSRLIIVEYLGHVEQGNWLEAASLISGCCIEPEERPDMQRLDPVAFDVDSIAAALHEWCRSGCDTTAPSAEELTFEARYGLTRGEERIAAGWFEGVYSISGLPFQTDTAAAD